MTEGLKKLALLLIIPVVVTLCWDLIDGWFVHAIFALDSLDKWWHKVGLSSSSETMVKSLITQVSSSTQAEKIFKAPASFVLAVPPIFFYLLYRIIFLLQGGKQGGYKSRH